MFHAIVFKRIPASPDFNQSQAVVLPGEHTAEAAWSAVFRAMRSVDCIGGEIRACAPLAGL